MLRRFILVSLLFTATAQAQITAPQNFSQAKTAGWKLYASNPVEFYCGCRYSGHTVDLKSCGYTPRKNPQRAARIEWEHIVPAWDIGHQLQCWQKGGRAQCERADAKYRLAEADLHNLVPAIGEVNGDRNNFGYSWLPQKPTQYGACPMVVDFKAHKAMPRPQVRGMVARTYFYMSKRYGLKLSRQDTQLYTAWNKQYPVQAWEKARNQRVACVMGHGNSFVGAVDLKACR